MPTYDAVVCGLGAMGSAALYHLARRGLRSVGVERFAPGHDRGSSHGGTRIIRLGYFEHPSYVPLLRRAYELWRTLEAESGDALMHITGIVEIGPPDGRLIKGTLLAAHLHNLRHEVLDAETVMRRFPAFRIPADYIGVFQPDGGHLDPEAAVRAQASLAAAAGAELRTGETVRTLAPAAGGVRLTTDRGVIDAALAVVAAGAWTDDLLPGALPLRVTRQVQAWFGPRDPALFEAERFPVFLLESRHGIHYGFPAGADGRVKIAKHHHGDQPVKADFVDRIVSADDEDLIRAALTDHIPAANVPMSGASTCLYTMTPDGDFIVDRLPDTPQVIVASACSGHGFKFCGVVGEIVAQLACDGASTHDISRFGLARFAG
jgi:sarcosine oxidase